MNDATINIYMKDKQQNYKFSALIADTGTTQA